MATEKQKNKGTQKLLFDFNDAGNESATIDILGGKGFHVMQSHHAGFPVPEAKILSTELCRRYKSDPNGVRSYLKNEAIPEIIKSLRRANGEMPLVSVRSGAKVSMPGMMDTILNVGLTKSNLAEWEKKIGPRAARDCRRRLLQMYGDVVCGIDSSKFEEALSSIKSKRRVHDDNDLNETDLHEVITLFERLFKKEGKVLPETIEEQVLGACEAVLLSWDNPRAKEYRKIRGYSEDWGTAILVQEMVFGNRDDFSCSGVLFTRNPAIGVNEPMGDFLVNAQGEDVVAGIRDPEPIYKMKAWNPEAYATLMDIAKKLELEARDVQDIEFTVESGRVYLLQKRTAQRSALAAIKIAVEMSRSGLISKSEALDRVSLAQYEQLCSPMIAPTFNAPADVKGLPASNGIATGVVVFSSDAAVNSVNNCILLSEETTPDDLPGMHAAKGILTGTGGVTSHAAVVARGMDKVCVVGASEIKFKKNKDGEIVSAKIGNYNVEEGDLITLDGATGRVWVGASVPVVPGGELPALLDFNDLIYDVFPVFRIVTDGRDLHEDFKMVYATYALDGLSDSKIRNEINESLPYLNGIIDLSTLEEHSPPEDAEVLSLGGSSKDEEVFKVKMNALLDFSGDKSKFKVHLGKRTDKYKDELYRYGFTVIEPGTIDSIGKDKSVFSVLSSGSPEKMEKLWSLAQKGVTNTVAAVASAPAELLRDLALKREKGEKIEPVLAMSVPQILASLKKGVKV